MKVSLKNILFIFVLVFFTGCAKKVPDIPDPKAKPIKIDIQKMETAKAKKIFLKTFFDYLISPVWKDNDLYSYHKHFYENVTKDYDFVGVQEKKAPGQESTLFLYQSKNFPGRKSVAIFSFKDTSKIRTVYIKKINRYALIISHANASIGYGTIRLTVINTYWRFTYPRLFGHFGGKFRYDDSKQYMLYNSGELTDKTADNYLVFSFLTKQDLEKFASVFLGAFPIIKM